MLILSDPRVEYMQRSFALLGDVLGLWARMYLQEQLRKQRELEKMSQLEQISRSLADVLGLSPTNTYVIGQPQFKLEQPTLDFSPTTSVKERIGEGLLGTKTVGEALGINLQPEGATFVDVMKSPQEYTSLVYGKALPLIARGAALGADFSKVVSSVVDQQKKAYEKVEEEAKKLQEIQRKALVADRKLEVFSRKYKVELAPSTRALLAMGMALGYVTSDDLEMIFKRKTQTREVEAPNGDKYLFIFDEETGEELRRIRFPFDPSNIELQERIKARYRKKTGGEATGTWRPIKDITGRPEEFVVGGVRYRRYMNSKTGEVRVYDLTHNRWLTTEELEKLKSVLAQETGKKKGLTEKVKEITKKLFGEQEEEKPKQKATTSKLSPKLQSSFNVFVDYLQK